MSKVFAVLLNGLKHKPFLFKSFSKMLFSLVNELFKTKCDVLLYVKTFSSVEAKLKLSSEIEFQLGQLKLQVPLEFSAIVINRTTYKKYIRFPENFSQLLFHKKQVFFELVEKQKTS